MKSLPYYLALISAICTFRGWTDEAWASHRAGPYEVEILVDGLPQPVHPSGGQSFIAGTYGAAYEIRVHNRTGGRIEALVAVDGRDVISGDRISTRRHRGHLVEPYDSVSIRGFRSSTARVATFRFSSIPESYAWRRGSAWGIGTVRVWVFEEARPARLPMPLPHVARRHQDGYYRAPEARAPGSRGHGSAAPRARRGGRGAESAPQAMGTSYGEQRWSPIGYTSFARHSSRPQAVLGLRYNSWKMLAAAGIVGRPHRYPVLVGYTESYAPGPFAPPPPPWRHAHTNGIHQQVRANGSHEWGHHVTNSSTAYDRRHHASRAHRGEARR